ncbi:MAG: FtsW/RodA/SpoVE family cell cycle protein, partial [Myxococcota bacterium]
SRPLATVGILAVGWNKPWLVDPIGYAARFIRGKLGGATLAAGDLMWFRALLIAFLLAACTLTILVIVRSARQRALLDPWPPGRRNRLIVLFLVLYAAFGAGLASAWNVPVVRDPFGVAVAGLSAAAAPGGIYETLQPGLTLRIGLALVAALYLAASVFMLRRGAAPLIDLVIAPIDLLVIPALLVLVEPDLGTAGVILLIGFTMILVVGLRLRTLIILGVLGACVAVVGWFGVLKDYQKRRILTFIDPEQDVQGAGWNAVQSIIAVGSGRWTGKGHMGGTQSQLSFLPEQHTDFAFSVWAEEQGFVGCLVLLALFLLLLVMALSIAANAKEAYGALLATGVAAMIFWQAIINVGMVIGALPVVGMTLPLFSYGGSSLLTVLLGAGLLLNVHMRRRSQ